MRDYTGGAIAQAAQPMQSQGLANANRIEKAPRIERITSQFETQLKGLEQLIIRFGSAVDRVAGSQPREGTERGPDGPPPSSALHRLENDVSMHEHMLARLHETIQRLEEL
jgi:hypothetical protein